MKIKGIVKTQKTLKGNIKTLFSLQEAFDAGKQAEQDRFWEEFQQGGTKFIAYTNAFAYRGWTDDIFNPKYPFLVGGGNSMFAYNTALTDTKQPIDISDISHTQLYYLFQRATNLKTIRKLITHRNRSYTNMFEQCNALENIVFEGEIGGSINFSWSPLTVESMKSVITHLVNFAGTSSEGKYTVTFTSTCWENLEADSKAPNGDTWKNYVASLGWLT